MRRTALTKRETVHFPGCYSTNLLERVLQRAAHTSTGTLDVRVRSTPFLPATLFSRFTILLSMLRQLYLLFHIIVTRELAQIGADVYVLDQLGIGLPVLRYVRPGARTLFYCHFPDLLLARGRARWWKRVYRVPFDWCEGWCLTWADRVLVNSRFTASVVRSVWPGLGALEVVYPCVDVGEGPGEETLGKGRGKGKEANKRGELMAMGETDLDVVPLWTGKRVLLSINRFEEKKGVDLAIKAYAALKKDVRTGVRLVIAGQYFNLLHFPADAL